MNPKTFHNAMVATVAAYGEQIQELQTHVVFLEAALKQAKMAAPKPEAHLVMREERAVIDAARRLVNDKGGDEVLRLAVEALDARLRPQGRPAINPDEQPAGDK